MPAPWPAPRGQPQGVCSQRGGLRLPDQPRGGDTEAAVPAGRATTPVGSGSKSVTVWRASCPQMPEHLRGMPQERDPLFTDMVAYNYHSAVAKLVPMFEKSMKGRQRLTDGQRKHRVEGIMRIMGSCSTCVEVPFVFVIAS